MSTFDAPACCGESTSLGVRALLLQPEINVHGDGLRVNAIYAAAPPPLFDRVSQDTSVQIRDGNGELVCATFGAAHGNIPARVYRFRDKGAALAGSQTGCPLRGDAGGAG